MSEITIAYLNFWYEDKYWFTKFFEHYFDHVRKVRPIDNPDILICTVFGPPSAINGLKAKCKIFFTGENLEVHRKEYANEDYLQHNFDLILGFSFTNLEKKTLRFPLWLLYYPYYDCLNENNLLTHLSKTREKYLSQSKLFLGSCVARHDNGGQRTKICDELHQYEEIKCPGIFHNNCPQIGQSNNDKLNFISKGWFNICPENSKGQGYWTEKIFQALEGGTIPIYWSLGIPEPEILNPKSFCFVDIDNDLDQQIKSFVQQKEDIIKQPVFLPTAKVTLQNYYESLIQEVRRILGSSKK